MTINISHSTEVHWRVEKALKNGLFLDVHLQTAAASLIGHTDK